MDQMSSSGAGSSKWLEVDEVVKNILGPESAYLRGHQQSDNAPTFATVPQATEEDSNQETSSFVQGNIFSVAGEISSYS